MRYDRGASHSSGVVVKSDTHALWRRWLIDEALPLWAREGYDPQARLYHERLTYNRAPVAVSYRRLMVQARQVATYCRAAWEGLYGDGSEALQCLAEIERLYHRPDGAPGWIFAIDATGAPANRTRDLYAHAFVIYAFFWAYRLTQDLRYHQKAVDTLKEVQTLFRDDGNGLRAVGRGQSSARNQDPIMHLLEACLVWIPVSSDAAFRIQASRIVRLAREHLIDPCSGMLLENFDVQWRPLHPRGQNRVEPGHLFEWSWLLRTYARLDLESQTTSPIDNVAEQLFQAGQSYGVVDGAVIDAIDEFGHHIAKGIRIWPQTEYYRLLADRRRDTTEFAEIERAMQRVTHVFFDQLAMPNLQGGWVDRRDAEGNAGVDDMPASSLYHIYGAATAE